VYVVEEDRDGCRGGGTAKEARNCSEHPKAPTGIVLVQLGRRSQERSELVL
jgi:hypothetical protein